MELEKREAAIEAILFTMGDAVEAEKIAAAIELDTPSTEKLLHEMMERYREEDRGIQMIELDHSYQLCTKKEYYETLIKIARQPQKIVLTDVLMETLSIIAYKQPVTRIEIEKIRGVKSDHAVNKLVEFGLVKELGRLDARENPFCSAQQRNFSATSGYSPWRSCLSSTPCRWKTSRARRKKRWR